MALIRCRSVFLFLLTGGAFWLMAIADLPEALPGLFQAYLGDSIDEMVYELALPKNRPRPTRTGAFSQLSHVTEDQAPRAGYY